MDPKSILKKMSLRDKIDLCSGADSWQTREFKAYGIPSITLNDGPHGVRKPANHADHLGIHDSLPATCFPTASATANSWDRAVLERMGAALGEEARELGVNVLLGPGVNIKRSPLCGRNFEYFSEDPYLSGELGAAFVKGVQSRGVGASLKHFAANNQETNRMIADSRVDERALREIYLAPFEKVVHQAAPATVMCAYNRLNGIYCSDHQILLTELLRGEWGFQGAVVSDWGAVHDRTAGIKAGLDLEMPGNGGYYAPILEQALKNGQLAEADIDACAERLLNLISSISGGVREPYDRDQHHLLARDIAVSSAVLLKNQQVLPLDPRKRVAVVGRTARSPRFQGSGSSHVNPTRLPCFLDALDDAGIEYRFFEGITEAVEQRELTDEELQGFKEFDAVLVFASLPEWAESEGYDRPDMQLPTSDNRLIEEIARVHTRVAVVLSAGAPVEMPWIDSVAAVLHMSLAGQAGGQAAADLIFGKANPSGKLAESYPLRWTDTTVCEFFGQDGKINRYKESIYVGYRYYDTAGVEVLFPFGHGLSYTHFEYSNARIEPIGSDEFIVSAEIRNTGSRDGEEIAQLYVSDQSQQVYRPQKELKGFEKVFLRAGEQQTVRFSLDRRAFAFYHPAEKSWFVPAGEFHILIGASSRDIRLCQAVRLAGDGDVPGRLNFDDLDWYRRPVGRVTDQDFARIYGEKIPPEETPRKGRYTIHSTLNDMRQTWIGRLAIKFAQRRNARQCGGADECNPEYRLMMEAATSTPLIGLALLSHGEMTPAVVKGIVEIANGRILKGIQTMIRGRN